MPPKIINPIVKFSELSKSGTKAKNNTIPGIATANISKPETIDTKIKSPAKQ